MTNTKTITLFILLTLSCLLTGCLVISTNDCSAGPCNLPPQSCKDPALAATLAEIDAVGKLFSDSAKRDAYKNIAQRPNLHPHAQDCLAKDAFKHLFADSAKTDVLTTLIKNPDFACPAKMTILKNLNKLFADSNKQAVLNALNEQQPCQTTEPPQQTQTQPDSQ